MPLADATRSLALLGPTNTGKTHRAVERMLEYPTGMIGLPLRLLAREIYDRVTARIGEDRVALVTGEEKRIPRRPDYWVCTTEAMPLSVEVDFLAVDEVQLATHDERGHVFTDRLLHARGRRESWFLGSHSMSGIVERLVPAARQERHPRLSRLSFSGQSTLGRLPPRSAVIGFSAPELYALAGRLRALRGGAALVLGALSPRTRNAQVAMFQSGEVDYLVATDAVGMGLNLDVSHVAFASLRKFDGRNARALESAELAQIAGRAGRYLAEGTFGTLSPVELPHDVAALIEQHRAEPVKRVRYRNSALDFSSAEALVASLEARPPAAHLAPVPDAVDVRALKTLVQDEAIRSVARSRAGLELLWSVCAIPDYRRILFEVHVALLRELFDALSKGPLSDDFLRARTLDLYEGEADVESLLARIARLRTWAFIANHADWVMYPEHWRGELERLETRLSDELHAALVGTFVESSGRRRRTQGRRAPAKSVEPSLAPSEGLVDRNHPFAVLERLRAKLRPCDPGPRPSGRLPSGQVASAFEDWVDAPHSTFQLDDRGRVYAGSTLLGALVRGSSRTLPDVRLAAVEELPEGLKRRLQRRLLAFARDSVRRFLGPIAELERAPESGLRAVAYHLTQGLGSARCSELSGVLDGLEDGARERLRESGVVIGTLAIFVPRLLERAALAQRALLTRVFEPGIRLPPLGRPHFEAQPLSSDAWLALGYWVLGARACRIDLVERVARDLSTGKSPELALRCLSLARRDRTRAFAALRQSGLPAHGPPAPSGSE